MRAAALRGTWIHQLLELLPAVSPDERPAAAERWLERSAGVTEEERRAEIVRQVCAVLSDPRFEGLFGPGSLGEAPSSKPASGAANPHPDNGRGTDHREESRRDESRRAISGSVRRRAPYGARQRLACLAREIGLSLVSSAFHSSCPCSESTACVGSVSR